jgi:hypothetical protein
LRIPLAIIIAILLTTSISTAQGLNKIVFGPLEGDEAAVLTVHNGEDIEIEMWVRTDPENPTPVVGLYHGLLSEDAIIAARNGVDIDPDYDVTSRAMICVDARQGPGRYSIKWNAGRLSSGLYFYRISAGDYVETRSCVFIK